MTQTPIDPTLLDKLAEVSVRTGLNLQPGQQLVLTAPVVALPLVRAVARHAYAAGASVVTPILADAQVGLARYTHANDDSFDQATGWLYEGMAKAFEDGAARMAIAGDDPMLLAAQDPSKVARVGKANSTAAKPAMTPIVTFKVNWSICAYPGADWAKRMFPDLPEDQAVTQLANAIFAASRVDQPDPVAAWADHNAILHERKDWLNGQRFSALHFRNAGTDLTVGLADDHEWQGGASPAQNGVTCNPNIPTEEVFTTPHAHRVDGYVRSSKPLSHQGSLIDGIEMVFENGRAVSCKSDKGEEVLQKLIATDEGAARLGEVALVPHSSPISQSGLLFYNTLFDENAACHIALGQCYSKCFLNGADLSEDDVAQKGGNSSLIHVDWMIGDGTTDIDGITANGDRVPVFRQGEWA